MNRPARIFIDRGAPGEKMAGRVDVRPDVRGHLNFSNGDYGGPV
jgi:hypothetical protein